MRRYARARLVSFVLCAMGALALVLAGCRKEEKAPEVPASSPASYMNDPAFRRAIDDKRKELLSVVKERAPLMKRMEELVRAHGKDLAVLRKIPEWNELHAKVVALNAKYEEVRQRQLKVVKERLAPEKGPAASEKGISK